MVDQKEMVHDGENNCKTPENVKMLENDSKLDDELTAKAALMQVRKNRKQLILMLNSTIVWTVFFFNRYQWQCCQIFQLSHQEWVLDFLLLP